MTRIKFLLRFVAATACGSAVTALFLRSAFADPGVPVPTPGIDWTFWIAIASALGTALSFMLHAIAGKTHSAKVEAVAKDLDALRGLIPASPPPALAIAPAPRDRQAGTTALGSMVSLAIGGLIALAVWACTAAQLKTDEANAKTSLVNCTAQALGTTPGLDAATLVAVVNLVFLERAKCSLSGTLDWKCVEGDLLGEGQTLGGCAFVKLLTAPSTATAVAAAATVDPGRSAFADFKVRIGAAAYHTSVGDL